MHLDLHLGANRRGSRIKISQHPHATFSVHRRKMNRGQIEALFGQRQQMFPLLTHPRTHGQTAVSNNALLVLLGLSQQHCIQLFPAANLRHRHHMIPPIVPVFPFHAALFMSFARRAKLRFKSPMRPERDKPFGLFPLLPAQDLLDGAAQIIESKCLEHPAKVLECQFVRFQKRLLAGVWIGPMKRPAARHAAHAERIDFPHLAVDLGVGFSYQSTWPSWPHWYVCGTNTSPPARPNSIFRFRTYCRTVDSATSHSGRSALKRHQIRCAVCRCLRGAFWSDTRIPSIQGMTGAIFALSRLACFRGFGTALPIASRTIRRCTPNFCATPLIVPTPCLYSRRICSNNSTFVVLLYKRTSLFRPKA